MESISFKGSFEQSVYIRCKEVNGAVIPLTDPATGYYNAHGYEAFERDDLISSLAKLVERVFRGGKQKDECKKWIRTNGFLTVPNYVAYEKGQSLEEFWQETIALVNLWKMYGEVVNRDSGALKGYVKISVENLSEDEIKNQEFLWGKGNDIRICVTGLFEGETAFGFKRNDIDEDPLAPYQFAVMQYISEKVSYNTGNIQIRYGKLEKHQGSETDTFTMEAYMEPACLLQALYLQFLQILTKKRKVCLTCWNSFVPSRKDQTFCSDGCRSTYHTRIRRELLKKVSG